MTRPNRTRRRIAPALVLLALAGAAATARGVGVEDRDDSAARVDIAEARGSHNRVTDELVHVVRAHEAFRPRDLRSREGPPGSICLNLWTTRVPAEAPPNYEVCVTADRRGRAFQASVARHGRSGAVRRAGPAKVEQPSSRRVEVRFDPARIRRPASYRWTAQATTFGEGCSAAAGCEDFAPDRPKTLETKIRKPRTKPPSERR